MSEQTHRAPGRVIANASVSLDGFVAYPDDSVGALFDWYDNGDVAVGSASPSISFHLTPPSAAYWRSWTESIGALVVGRRLFDVTDGWGGVHPLGVPVVVVTHEPPTDWSYPGSADFTFVTEGVGTAVAVAQQLAGDKNVGVAAGTIAGQCLAAGLLDAAALDLVPIVLGAGKPFFGELSGGTARLGNPTGCVQGDRVTHLFFPVEQASPGTAG